MTSDEWLRVKAIAVDAFDEPPERRSSYIAARCAGDCRLRDEVDSLVRAMGDAADLYESAALDVVAADVRLPVETHVGPYRLIHEIGRGGMGAVFMAERVDGAFDQRVAIKFSGGGIQSPLLRHRFMEERRILARLDHPHIARLLDGGTTAEGAPYVVMEYIEGIPIDEFCDARRLSVRERLELFRVVCNAVHFAHQRLVVHCDIKPANILVAPDGTPKLLDFGIARLLNPDLSTPARTLVRALTPASASPEQISGAPITVATDIYALGALLYRVLTGCGPYGSDTLTEAELVRAIRHAQPAAPSAAARAREPIDRDLDLIVLKALRKEPERRYDTALQFSTDVQWHLEGRPVLAAPDTRGYRARKFLRRHRIGAMAAAMAALAILGGTSAALWQAQVARQERAVAQQRLDMVQKLAQSVVFDVNDALRDLPGSLQARRIVVSTAVTYLAELRRQIGSDPRLIEQLAAAYLKVGDIQGNPYQPNVGDTSSALVSYEQARGLYDQLATAPPSPSVLRGRIDARTDTGDLRWSLGQFGEALTAYRDALALAEGWLTREPGNDDSRSLVGRAHYRIGQTLLRTEDIAGARDSYRRAVAVFAQLAAAHPENPTHSRNLATGELKMGDVELELGEFATASATYERAGQQFGASIAQYGEHGDSGRIMTMLALRASTALEALGRYRDAEVQARRAISFLTPRLQNGGDDIQLVDDDGYAHLTLGTALAAQGHDDEAAREYARSIGAYRQVLAANPKYLEARRELGFALRENADVALRRGDTKAAVATYDEAAGFLESPDVRPQAILALAKLYLREGDARRRAGDATAQRSYQKSYDTWRELGSRRSLTASEMPLQHEAEVKRRN